MKRCLTLGLSLFFFFLAGAQPITGVWSGKTGPWRIELKLIKRGDSLTGTAYYFTSGHRYRRYSVKGYFDDRNNQVVWWDDRLLSEEGHAMAMPLLAMADFNCPGEGILKLDGKISPREDEAAASRELHLQKGGGTQFPDEWDYVIDNYAYGASDPDLIDSVSAIAFRPPPVPAGYEEAPIDPPAPVRSVAVAQPAAPAPLTNLEKFRSRRNVLQTVIPLYADSVELRFYDNAEIDGDSIAIFLNGKLLEEHILLGEQPHTIRLAVSGLQSSNDLVMVAENLGSIPPNTSLMVAIAGDKRYEAHLQSSEGSSALVRLVKP